MIRYLYTLLLIIISPFLFYSLYKKKPGKPIFGARWKEHFGITPSLNTNQPPIWIHAVSVGEVIAAIPVIKALKAENPNQTILVTTTTSTGAEQMSKHAHLAEHRYMPVDFVFAVRGFLKVVKPMQLLIMETELWPNTIHTVHQFNIPISIINARLSEKSYLAYKRALPIFNLFSKKLTHVCCQYQADAERFIKLGLSKEKAFVTGSVKFDIKITEQVIISGHILRKKLGSERPIWIAASTHHGEDDKILDAHAKLLKTLPNALLILVPRHPERFNAVLELCQRKKLTTIIRTSQEPVISDTQIYLGDTMGEMLTLIGAADICFMGGSLIGDKVGGHNILEPIALNVATLIGPSYFNFAEIVNTLVKHEACIITTAEQIDAKLLALLTNIDDRKKLSLNASTFMLQQTGAIDKTINVILTRRE